MRIIQLIALTIITTWLFNCEAKPDKGFNGLPPEDAEKIITGLVLNTGVTDTRAGTITDIRTGLEWKKCSQGQEFRSSNNDCQGKTTGTLFTPLDQARYGATYLSYCSFSGNDCNTTAPPMTLKLPANGFTSEAYSSCDSDRTRGFSNWRVPTYAELKALSAMGKTTLNIYFPNTVDDLYWTSWSNEQDLTAKTARAINFNAEKIGDEENVTKETRLYVRCVRSMN